MTSDDLEHPINELVLICCEDQTSTTLHMTPEARLAVQRAWKQIESERGERIGFDDFLVEAIKRSLLIVQSDRSN